MIFSELTEGKFYIFQPLPVQVQYPKCRPMTAYVTERVQYLGDNDEGWHVFEKRNKECFALHTCVNLFEQ